VRVMRANVPFRPVPWTQIPEFGSRAPDQLRLILGIGTSHSRRSFAPVDGPERVEDTTTVHGVFAVGDVPAESATHDQWLRAADVLVILAFTGDVDPILTARHYLPSTLAGERLLPVPDGVSAALRLDEQRATALLRPGDPMADVSVVTWRPSDDYHYR